MVIGIVSYGIGCAKKDVPGLYTRTSAYINWIKDITMHGKDSSVSFKLIEAKQAETRDQTSQSTARPKQAEHDTTITGKPKEASRRSTTRRFEQEIATTKSISGHGGFKFFDE